MASMIARIVVQLQVKRHNVALNVHCFATLSESIIAAFIVDGMVNDPESRAFLEDLAGEG